MVELIFIGTLHCGFTNENELKKIISDTNPDLLLIEITEKDIQLNHISKYPEEMIFALNLAKQNNIVCKGFDSDINVLKKGTTSKDEQVIIKKQEQIIKNNSWKDFNKYELNQKLSKIGNKIIDFDKWNLRENEMKLNIEKLILRKRIVLILTGSGHIPFFKKNFSNAKFPLSS